MAVFHLSAVSIVSQHHIMQNDTLTARGVISLCSYVNPKLIISIIFTRIIFTTREVGLSMLAAPHTS